MFGLGTQELLIILVLVMIIFGAGKLPRLAELWEKGCVISKKGSMKLETILKRVKLKRFPRKMKMKRRMPDCSKQI